MTPCGLVGLLEFVDYPDSVFSCAQVVGQVDTLVVLKVVAITDVELIKRHGVGFFCAATANKHRPRAKATWGEVGSVCGSTEQEQPVN